MPAPVVTRTWEAEKSSLAADLMDLGSISISRVPDEATARISAPSPVTATTLRSGERREGTMEAEETSVTLKRVGSEKAVIAGSGVAVYFHDARRWS
jgi:hypothetical protein